MKALFAIALLCAYAIYVDLAFTVDSYVEGMTIDRWKVSLRLSFTFKNINFVTPGLMVQGLNFSSELETFKTNLAGRK